MVESAALEKRYARKGIVSSNLTPSALCGENANVVLPLERDCVR